MSKIRELLASIQANLGKLTPSQKLLIGSLAVIAGMVLFLVSRYAAEPEYVTLMAGLPAAEQTQAQMLLEAAGIKNSMVDGQLSVEPGTQIRAISVLSENGQMPADFSTDFENLLERQDWRLSREQNHQQFTFALQNELGRIISQFSGIRSAKVFIDNPAPSGLGRASRKPTASVTAFTKTGQPLSQNQVNAIASLVAGASSGMTPAIVRVIDGANGNQRRVQREDEVLSSTYIEHQSRVERDVREKVEDLLAYIPGVMVAVTAQVDVTRVDSQIQKHLPLNEGTLQLPVSTQETSESQQAASRGAAPGTRANVQLSIEQSGGSGTSFEKTSDTSEFQNAVGSEVSRIVDPRGMPTFLAASVNIPSGFIVDQIRRRQPAVEGGEAPEITPDQVDAEFATMRASVIASVEPHLKVRSPDGAMTAGEVNVSLIPMDSYMPVGESQEAGMFNVGGIALGADGSLIDTVIVGALAVVALGMMIGMVKRSGKRVELPSAEELVGIPPALAGEQDLIGEADETDSAMSGIEVTDDEVEKHRILEQVTDLVRQDPDTAAKLVSRWIGTDEE